MSLPLRVLGVVLVFFIGAMLLHTLQNKYDESDLKKASSYLYQFKPAGQDKTMIELMSQSYGVAVTDVLCSGEILSRYEGRILVECNANSKTANAAPAEPFRFEVEILGFQTRPLDDRTRTLFGEAK